MLCLHEFLALGTDASGTGLFATCKDGEMMERLESGSLFSGSRN